MTTRSRRGSVTIEGQLRLFDIPPCRGIGDDPYCVGCGVHTIKIGEFYMVHADAWPLDPLGGMLCIGCLEEGIGRRLSPADFSDVAINRDGCASARLRSRQGWTS